MKVSTSGYYQRLREPVTAAERADAHRANEVHDIWKMSGHSYGMPRIRDEFRLGGAGANANDEGVGRRNPGNGLLQRLRISRTKTQISQKPAVMRVMKTSKAKLSRP